MKTTKEVATRDATVAVVGPAAAARKKASTLDKCKKAMSDMERDVAANGGVYPFNGGRITVQEVLRRANLSAAALEKPHHRSLKTAVSEWTALATKKVASRAKDIRKIVTQRVDDANIHVKQIQQAWVEAELEYIEAQREMARLTQENATLRREMDELRRKLSDNSVVPFHR